MVVKPAVAYNEYIPQDTHDATLAFMTLPRSSVWKIVYHFVFTCIVRMY